MLRLKARADFVAAAAAPRVPRSGFILQCRSRGDTGPARVGFTVSKKVGNAVERNRVRRRLREAVRHSAADWICLGNDYVLVGRRAALTIGFQQLLDDLAIAGSKIARNHRA
jgi:ribonuclease P protein component